MAEKILNDTKLLVEFGRSQSEYESDDDWDPAYFSVVDTGQLNLDAKRIYHYFPSIGLFCHTTRRVPGIYRAAKTLFTPERWEEIEDILDEHGSREMLHLLNLGLFRRKLARARSKGLITVSERTSLVDLLAHLVDGAE